MDRARAMTVLRCLLVVVPLLASHAGAQEGGPPEAVTPALRTAPSGSQRDSARAVYRKTVRAALTRADESFRALSEDSLHSAARVLVGEVKCVGGVPVPHYPETTGDVVHGVDRVETVKHETMHVAQLMGGCDSILALWERDPVARADAEIQATCAGLEVYADTTRRRQRLNEARTALMMIYARWIQAGDIYAALEAWCRP